MERKAKALIIDIFYPILERFQRAILGNPQEKEISLPSKNGSLSFYFLLFLYDVIFVEAKMPLKGLLSLQLIEISMITATKNYGRIEYMLMGFGFDTPWKMNMEHKNGGFGR